MVAASHRVLNLFGKSSYSLMSIVGGVYGGGELLSRATYKLCSC